MKSVPFFKQSALLKPAVWELYDVLPLKNLSRLRLLPFVKGPLIDPKNPHDVFGLAGHPHAPFVAWMILPSLNWLVFITPKIKNYTYHCFNLFWGIQFFDYNHLSSL
jgi:hypothetical protein